ncbi:MAG: PhzF family phenazine biosynthesis protein [Gemmatimonadales bacterium]
MTLPLHLIDAFAEAPFTGNPAAVVLLDTPRPDAWMQHVATEMNQAETAFLRQRDDGYTLRWFTPNREVDLCGHATLASAHYLWESGQLAPAATARFDTRSGWLLARQDAGGWITLDFPVIISRPATAPANITAALGVTPREIWRGTTDLMCVVDDAATVRRLAPDLAAIAAWEMRGVLVTAPGDMPGVDFISRCFFPAFGVPEDSVTGSAHCALAHYWSDVLQRDTVVGYQASARGGTVRCRTMGDRVELTGRAVTTVRGTLAA